jgi:methanogenic corrinoid protein MtbC1
MALHTTVSHPTRSGVIVAAGAPGEQHTIGMLMLVAMLRMRGWDVRYLGPDTPLDGMERTLAPLKPRLLMFTCNQPESTRRLFAALPRLLEALGGDAPRVIVGGQAFGRGNIDVPPVAYVIDEDEPDTIALIEHAMAPSPVAFPSPRTEAVE